MLHSKPSIASSASLQTVKPKHRVENNVQLAETTTTLDTYTFTTQTLDT